MSGIDSKLAAGERVVFQTKLHWIRFLRPVLCVVAGLALGDNPAASALIGFGAFLCFAAFLDFQTSQFVLTDRRVFLQRGILRRRSVEVLLSKIESLSVDQSILGGIFDYGSICPTGSGGTQQLFPLIAKPMLFRQHVNAGIEAHASNAKLRAA